MANDVIRVLSKGENCLVRDNGRLVGPRRRGIWDLTEVMKVKNRRDLGELIGVTRRDKRFIRTLICRRFILMCRSKGEVAGKNRTCLTFK